MDDIQVKSVGLFRNMEIQRQRERERESERDGERESEREREKERQRQRDRGRERKREKEMPLFNGSCIFQNLSHNCIENEEGRKHQL